MNRTTIFAQVLLYAEIAVWMVIAAEGVFGRAPAPAGREPAPADGELPEVLDRPRQPLRSDTATSMGH